LMGVEKKEARRGKRRISKEKKGGQGLFLVGTERAKGGGKSLHQKEWKGGKSEGCVLETNRNRGATTKKGKRVLRDGGEKNLYSHREGEFSLCSRRENKSRVTKKVGVKKRLENVKKDTRAKPEKKEDPFLGARRGQGEKGGGELQHVKKRRSKVGEKRMHH